MRAQDKMAQRGGGRTLSPCAPQRLPTCLGGNVTKADQTMKKSELSAELMEAIALVVRAELGAALTPASHGPQFFTIKETMATLSLSRTALYRLAHAGALPLLKRGRRSLISAAAVREFAAKLQ